MTRDEVIQKVARTTKEARREWVIWSSNRDSEFDFSYDLNGHRRKGDVRLGLPGSYVHLTRSFRGLVGRSCSVVLNEPTKEQLETALQAAVPVVNSVLNKGEYAHLIVIRDGEVEVLLPKEDNWAHHDSKCI